MVYSFRYGNYRTAMALMRDGSAPEAVSVADGKLPTTLPRPAGEVSMVDVTLPVTLLQRWTFIDTPGMASTTDATSAVTRRLLSDTQESASGADALVFCVNGPLRGDEAEAVQVFRSGIGGQRLTGGTAVALLTKADQLSDDRTTTMKSASEQAQRMSVQHADLFAAVVPVVGLLAQTAATGALRETHARALAELSRAWNPDDANEALIHASEFLAWPGPVESSLRQELIGLLGLFGVGELLDALRAGTAPNATELTAVARAASGFDAMTARLEFALGSRADVLKAARAVAQLMSNARHSGASDVYGAGQALLDRPEMFPLRVLEVARLLASGQVQPPAGLVEQAWIVVTSGVPAASPRDAAAAATAWREWMMLTDGEGQRVARIMIRAWQLAASGGERP